MFRNKIWWLRRPDEGSGGGGQPNGAEPPSAPASVEPSSPSVRETQIGSIPEDIMSLFDGDPQASPPAAPSGGEETPPSPSPPTPSVAPTPGQAPTPGAPTPQAPTSGAPAALDPAVLAGQVQTLTQLVSRQIAQGQPPAGGQPPAPAEPELPTHQYQMTIPDGLDTALISDDPAVRKQAIGALVQGTAQTVHREVVKSMRAEFARVLPNIIQTHITQSRQQSAVAQDFYGTFPQYAHPAFKPIVVQLAQQVAQETGARTWSVELRNKVGERLGQLIQAVSGQQIPNGGQPPAVPGPQLPPRGPAAINPGGARPSMGADPTQQFRELLL
jgi:hypothetical protein